MLQRGAGKTFSKPVTLGLGPEKHEGGSLSRGGQELGPLQVEEAPRMPSCIALGPGEATSWGKARAEGSCSPHGPQEAEGEGGGGGVARDTLPEHPRPTSSSHASPTRSYHPVSPSRLRWTDQVTALMIQPVTSTHSCIDGGTPRGHLISKPSALSWPPEVMSTPQ